MEHDANGSAETAECSLEGIALLGNLARIGRLMSSCPEQVEVLSPEGYHTGAYARRRGGVWRLEADVGIDPGQALARFAGGGCIPRRLDSRATRDLLIAAVDRTGADRGDVPSMMDVGWSYDERSRENAMRAVIRSMPRHSALAAICHAGGNPDQLPESFLADDLDQAEARLWNGQWAKALAAEGFSLDDPPSAGMPTPLVAAAGRGCKFVGIKRNVKVMSDMVAAGADPDRRAGDIAPVQAAFSACDPEMIAALVGLGADVDTRYPDGGTMLHRLAGRFQTWPEESIISMGEILVENGASLEALDHDGRTPLERLAQARRDLQREDPLESDGVWRLAMSDLVDLYAGSPTGAPGL